MANAQRRRATPSLGTRAGDSNHARRAGRFPDPVLPDVEKKRSRLHGWGVFALEPIPKNKRIVAYEGEKISHAESVRRERRYIRNGNIWCFKLNNRWVIDGSVGGNAARFINHSCKPNCYTQIIGGTIWVRAARNIRRGEELTYNYYTDGEALIQCRCRPGCKGML
jgi:SET domain-containing protein